MDISTRSPDIIANLHDVARRVCDDLLRANCVEQFQTLLHETLSQCLLDTRDEVLCNNDWLDKDWDFSHK